MKSNFFFFKKKLKIKDLFPNSFFKKNVFVNEIKPLEISKKNDLSFFENIKYKSFAEQTSCSFCITTNKLEKFLPKNVEKIVVKNVLLELAITLKKIICKRFRN